MSVANRPLTCSAPSEAARDQWDVRGGPGAQHRMSLARASWSFVGSTKSLKRPQGVVCDRLQRRVGGSGFLRVPSGARPYATSRTVTNPLPSPTPLASPSPARGTSWSRAGASSPATTCGPTSRPATTTGPPSWWRCRTAAAGPCSTCGTGSSTSRWASGPCGPRASSPRRPTGCSRSCGCRRARASGGSSWRPCTVVRCAWALCVALCSALWGPAAAETSGCSPRGRWSCRWAHCVSPAEAVAGVVLFVRAPDPKPRLRCPADARHKACALHDGLRDGVPLLRDGVPPRDIPPAVGAVVGLRTSHCRAVPVAHGMSVWMRNMTWPRPATPAHRAAHALRPSPSVPHGPPVSQGFELLCTCEIALVGGSKGAVEMYPPGFFSSIAFPDVDAGNAPLCLAVCVLFGLRFVACPCTAMCPAPPTSGVRPFRCLSLLRSLPPSPGEAKGRRP